MGQNPSTERMPLYPAEHTSGMRLARVPILSGISKKPKERTVKILLVRRSSLRWGLHSRPLAYEKINELCSGAKHSHRLSLYQRRKQCRNPHLRYRIYLQCLRSISAWVCGPVETISSSVRSSPRYFAHPSHNSAGRCTLHISATLDWEHSPPRTLQPSHSSIFRFACARRWLAIAALCAIYRVIARLSRRASARVSCTGSWQDSPSTMTRTVPQPSLTASSTCGMSATAPM